LIENFQAGFDFIFSSVIVIAIDKLIRNDQGLIENCRAIHNSEDALGAAPHRWGTPGCDDDELSSTTYIFS
jgi:hypothetical protein